ncbi:Hcp transcriptional regulator HcpR (Crp/Fnr family) [Anaerovibrio sp. JC8]|uniref:Crp/Fnr family transcriptional regulator n=1 Tax=Anaerovibrio sp. JC8 TaxID=1240085 RepID=UPI000A0E6F5B|nr:Crp/Fnr family transcriptional regulator [Anaerovibrio sp. JC8]ORU00647.1 Hcp transcriptional regulator HcpR (Crp/Fnr family) [Anaerovibrio sp. JC8]
MVNRKEMDKYMPILSNCSFFGGMESGEIQAVLGCIGAYIIKAEKGKYIFRAGDSTDVMGMVLSGGVFIIQEDVWGHRNIMAKCHPGDFFGEIYAASPGSVLNISVIAEADTTVLMMDVKRLMSSCSSACDHHQRLIRNLVGVLANKVMAFNEKITHISKRSTREKLLSFLSNESQRQGSLSFDIPFNRQELADYLCVERAAMTVEISKLQKEGILKTNRKHFELSAQ